LLQRETRPLGLPTCAANAAESSSYAALLRCRAPADGLRATNTARRGNASAPGHGAAGSAAAALVSFPSRTGASTGGKPHAMRAACATASTATRRSAVNGVVVRTGAKT
jgi:hypothetical protein